MAEIKDRDARNALSKIYDELDTLKTEYLMRQEEQEDAAQQAEDLEKEVVALEKRVEELEAGIEGLNEKIKELEEALAEAYLTSKADGEQ